MAHKMVGNVKVDLTPEEEAARDAEIAQATADRPKELFAGLRKQRNVKLAETDWWGASDQTMTDAQKKYRSDLRDLPAQYDNSSILSGEITWPSKP
jgi:hypothetical protein